MILNITGASPGKMLHALALLLVVGSYLCSTSLRESYAQTAQTSQPITAQMSSAHQALMEGRIDDAVRSLKRILAADPGNGEASLLLCRSFYAEEHAEETVAACESAVQHLPGNSDAWDWMGRAYGMKAGISGPVAAFTLARKVRDCFERSVALNPRNGAAMSDLGEFYIKAPAVVGGGIDKAIALASGVKSQLPQEAHRIDGLAAEMRNDEGTAEREFKDAVAVANRPEAWNDLGAFYIKQGQSGMAQEALNKSLLLDRAHGPATVDAAMLLDNMQREPKVAEDAFQHYLSGDATTDAQPVIRVDVALGRLLALQGDKSQARIEFNNALRLASDYLPAREALQGL